MIRFLNVYTWLNGVMQHSKLKGLLFYYADNQELVDNKLDVIGNFITSGPINLSLFCIGVAISAVLLLYCGIDSLIAMALVIVVALILSIISVACEGETDITSGSILLDTINDMKNEMKELYGIDEEDSKLNLEDGIDTIDLIELKWLDWSFRLAFASLVLSWFGVKAAIGTLYEKFTWSKLLIMFGSVFSLIVSVIAIALCPISVLIVTSCSKQITTVDDIIESSIGIYVAMISFILSVLSIGICVFSYGIGAVPNMLFGIATATAVISFVVASANLWFIYSNEKSTYIGV